MIKHAFTKNNTIEHQRNNAEKIIFKLLSWQLPFNSFLGRTLHNA